MITRQEFESAVRRALESSPKSGQKWAPLERVFHGEGIRAQAALNNDLADSRTRIRQILTKKAQAGFTDDDHCRLGFLVIAQDAADEDRRDETFIDKLAAKVVRERPDLPARDCMAALLILRVDKKALTPRRLLVWGEHAFVPVLKGWYKGLQVDELSAPAAKPLSNTGIQGKGALSGDGAATNTIFFGPPGTGKSHSVAAVTADFAATPRTVFHPEYSYADFIGNYKPLTGHDRDQKIVAFDGTTEIARPVLYYGFEPGVLCQAVIKAFRYAPEPVALIIEEINRGDCAAIFGDFFQLLDRTPLGTSQYGIRVHPALGRFLTDAGVLDTFDAEFFLPGNLFLYATMNTADQSLFPMDAAFKRRWEWRSVPVDYAQSELKDLVAEDGSDSGKILWLDLLRGLNERIVDLKLEVDKRVGQWFLPTVDGKISRADIRGKLLFYLWHDVFRDREDALFLPELDTFDAVQEAYERGGLKSVLRLAKEGVGVQSALPPEIGLS